MKIKGFLVTNLLIQSQQSRAVHLFSMLNALNVINYLGIFVLTYDRRVFVYNQSLESNVDSLHGIVHAFWVILGKLNFIIISKIREISKKKFVIHIDHKVNVAHLIKP